MRPGHAALLSLSVQVTMKLARRSLRMKRMKLERMMVRMVKLLSHLYLYFHYDDYGAGWHIYYTDYDPARPS
jgi:hypothetical protein